MRAMAEHRVEFGVHAAIVRAERTGVWTVFGQRVCLVRVEGAAVFSNARGRVNHLDDVLLCRGEGRARSLADSLVQALSKADGTLYYATRRFGEVVTRNEVPPAGWPAWGDLIDEAKAARARWKARHEGQRGGEETIRESSSAANDGPGQPRFKSGQLVCDRNVRAPVGPLPCVRIHSHDGPCDPGLLTVFVESNNVIRLACGHTRTWMRGLGRRTRCAVCSRGGFAVFDGGKREGRSRLQRCNRRQEMRA